MISFVPPEDLYLTRFHLEGATPVWSYRLNGAIVEKRTWTEPGENTTTFGTTTDPVPVLCVWMRGSW